MTTLFVTNQHCQKYGTIRLEEWPEGIALWVGGEIKWKSWEPRPQLAKSEEIEVKLRIKVEVETT